MVYRNPARAKKFWNKRSGAYAFARLGNNSADGGLGSRGAGYGYSLHDPAHRSDYAVCVGPFDAIHGWRRTRRDSSRRSANRIDAVSVGGLQSLLVAEHRPAGARLSIVAIAD